MPYRVKSRSIRRGPNANAAALPVSDPAGVPVPAPAPPVRVRSDRTMRRIDWVALGRSSVALVADRVLRGLLTLGTMATGVTQSDWLKARGDHWWEGAAPTKGTGPRSVVAAARADSGSLSDRGLLRKLRSLRGSQDLPRLGETASAYEDAAPEWHPERRSPNDD